MTMNKKKIDSATIISAVIVLALYAAVFIAEQLIPATSMLFTVIKKGATYALVAVSMNLLNGFTGIFSLGQAGFMLIGAYVYGIFTIPLVNRMDVYQYYNGGLVQFTLPVFAAMLLAGLAAAFFAFLIGLPVLRLKSDYLAIATLGFAEIIRALFQWDKLGPVTNGSNMLRLFPSFNDFNIKNADGTVAVYFSTLVPLLIAGVCIGVIILLINSTFGRALRAMKDDEIAVLDRAVDLLKERLYRYRRTKDNYGMIHSDLRAANLLVNGDQVAVLDFDDCGRGWYMYEIAGIVALLEYTPQLPEMLLAIVRGYEEILPLTQKDKDEIMSFVLMRRIGMLQSLESRIGSVAAGEGESTELTPQILEFYAAGTIVQARQYLETYAVKPAASFAFAER